MPGDDVSPSSENNTPYRPTVVGDYLVQDRLGGGEFSSTYKGIHKQTQEEVAIKVWVKPAEEGIQLYEAEIRAYDILKDVPGVLPLLNHGKIEATHEYYIVTAFLREGSIRNLFKDCPEGMDIDVAMELFKPIAETIDHIHDSKIIHRDLKPENILYRRTARGFETFITDFGTVKFTATSQEYQTEHIAGTWSYMAPEALLASPESVQSKAVDIYALGVMLYEALEGRLPYENINQVIYKQPASLPIRTRQRAGDYVSALLLKSIDFDPGRRLESAREVVNSIHNAMIGHLNERQKEEQHWVGRKILNYKIEEVLGTGKMGTTLRARDMQSNKQVVLKAFAQSEQRNTKAYQKEVESFQRLEDDHGILRPLSTFDYESDSFIVTEYQSGGTLRNLLTRRPKVPTNEMLEIFMQVAEAIDYIHEKRVVHRDIKPENIVYSIQEGKIKPFITDFGVSAILASTQGSFPTHHIGTLRYMAPELHDENIRGTKAVDIYAFGVMLYEALEGHAPLETPGRRRPQSPDLLTADRTQKELGINAKNILLQSLARDPVERPRTATEIMQQVRRQGMHEMLLGKKFGKYTIEKFIGRGSYGATYRAYITKGKKKFAFKVLSAQTPLMHEVEKLKRLRPQEGIALITDGGSENGIHYVVTDYFNGGSLRDELQGYHSGMDLDEALKLFKPIAKSIDYLHENGVVHGDIKPENVILCKSKNNARFFEPVITGFGISRIVGNVQQFLASNNYNYIAPELWEDKEPSFASDIYAFGIMLYETLEGAPPFPGKSLAETMNQHLQEKPPLPKNLAQLRGKRAVKALLQSLSKDPALRQASAQALITLLEDKTQDSSTTTAFGSITGPLIRFVKQIMKSGQQTVELSRAHLVMYAVIGMAILAVLSQALRPVFSPTPITPSATPAVTGTSHVTEAIPPAIAAATTVAITLSPEQPTFTPTSLVSATPLPPKCVPQYSIPEAGCNYTPRDAISVEALYKLFYTRAQTRYDEIAIAYYNNHKAVADGRYSDMIDLDSFEVARGQTVFLPPSDWIEEFSEDPRPVLEPMDTGSTSSTINISGSSALYPLSSKIQEQFTKMIAGYQVNIEPNNTRQGLSDFCGGRAEIFMASEENLPGCGHGVFMRFEVARFAVAIYMSEDNPFRAKLEDKPLNSQELVKLLTSAKTWKDVREDLDPTGEEVVTRYYPDTDSGTFEIVKKTIFPTVGQESIENLHPNPEEAIPGLVQKDTHSIGFSAYPYYQDHRDNLVPIAVRNVRPNPGTIEGETPDYPLTRQVYLYTDKDTYYGNALVRFFINYYLSYEADYLNELGYFGPNRIKFLYNLSGNPIR
jgi:eukaryotic-like serine/threonine-protein kinase